MEQLLELFLTGGIRLPLFDPELTALDRELPKSDFLALLMLQRRGEATMSELAADLGAPLSTATGVGARLERRGLVARERHPRDKRVIVLQLTPDGQALAQRARTHIDRVLGKVQQALTPEEMQQLMGLVTKILGALQAPPPDEERPGASGLKRIAIEE